MIYFSSKLSIVCGMHWYSRSYSVEAECKHCTSWHLLECHLMRRVWIMILLESIFRFFVGLLKEWRWQMASVCGFCPRITTCVRSTVVSAVLYQTRTRSLPTFSLFAFIDWDKMGFVELLPAQFVMHGSSVEWLEFDLCCVHWSWERVNVSLCFQN